jgi:phenylpyruvate tautomerase
MPIIVLQTSVSCSEDEKKLLAKRLSSLCSMLLGKPEAYVLSMVHDNVTLLFGGNLGRAALVDLKSIGGLNPVINKKISKEICNFLVENLAIEPTNIYIHFIDIPKDNLGWDGSTFG